MRGGDGGVPCVEADKKRVKASLPPIPLFPQGNKQSDAAEQAKSMIENLPVKKKAWDRRRTRPRVSKKPSASDRPILESEEKKGIQDGAVSEVKEADKKEPETVEPANSEKGELEHKRGNRAIKGKKGKKEKKKVGKGDEDNALVA